MNRNMPVYIAVFVLLLVTLACSISSIQSGATSAEKTAAGLGTDVGGIVSEGGALLKTARVLETENPGILSTVKAVATQGAPLLSTIEGVATNNPGLVQTAQALIHNEVPTGVPPDDIPIFNRSQVQSFLGYSQYIFYISPSQYKDVLKFYQTEMINNGWQYQQSQSSQSESAAHLVYAKDNRTASIDMSVNPLNNTTVVVINITTH